MTKLLTYINGQKLYVQERDGGNAADTQSLNLDVRVDTANINGSIGVVETNDDYDKYASENHKYYKIDNVGGIDTYAIDVDNPAIRLPKHITGWKYFDNGSMIDFEEEGNVVDQHFIDTYFPLQTTNLNLYANWATTHFLRVIIADFNGVFNGNSSISTDISVDVTNSSYNGNEGYSLRDSFMATIDRFKYLEHNKIYNIYTEVSTGERGTGHGCPMTVDGETHPTYYGFKPNTTSSIVIKFDDFEGREHAIPDYEVANGVVIYKCYSYNGLTNYYSHKDLVSHELIKLVDQPAFEFRGMMPNNDVTLFIPLAKLPKITVYSQDTEQGLVSIDNGTAMGLQAKLVYPATVCTINAHPSSGYSFVGWYKNNLQYSQSTSVSVTVNSSVEFEARFSVGTYTLSYHQEPISE